jgi:hypothetical protein
MITHSNARFLLANGPISHPLQFLRAADVPKKAVEWLWPGRIAIGKVTLLVGDPGLGKSLLALDIAARVSSAAPWPDERVESEQTRVQSQESRVESPTSIPGSPLSALDSGLSALDSRLSALDSRLSALDSRLSALDSRLCDSRLPSSAVLLSAEDDLGDTVRPRLEAHSADCERVFVLSSLADLRHDFEQLQYAINGMPNCRLIVIDPINAYVGPNDSHFHTIVRKILAPLAKFAAAKRMAVLAVTHLRKHDGAAIYRATGSMGFVAAARAVWIVCRDRETPGRHLMLPIKNNLSHTACGLAYTIQPHPHLAAPVIHWHPQPVDTSADEALSAKRGPEAEDRIAAERWLRQVLTERGPQAASDLIEEGSQHGFHSRTLQRAMRVIGAKTEKRGILEGWWWSLPPGATNSPPTAPEKPVAFEETCRLRETSRLR